MRVLITALVLACGCGDSGVYLITNDGGAVVTCMQEDPWVKCMHDACPNGYDILKSSTDNVNGIVKCKP